MVTRRCSRPWPCRIRQARNSPRPRRKRIGSSLTRAGESKERTIAALRTLGASHFFVSSDAGLTGELNETDTLVLAARALREAGFSEADLAVMYKDNPAYLVRLPAAAGSGQLIRKASNPP